MAAKPPDHSRLADAETCWRGAGRRSCIVEEALFERRLPQGHGIGVLFTETSRNRTSTVAQAIGDGSQRFGCLAYLLGRKRPRVRAAAHRSEPDVVKRQVPRKARNESRETWTRRAAQQDRTLPLARGKSLIENVRGTSACGEEVDGRSGSYASLRSSGGFPQGGTS